MILHARIIVRWLYFELHIGVHVLVTESTSFDPTKGSRYVKELDIQSANKVAVSTITPTNHNYSGATYLTNRHA